MSDKGKKISLIIGLLLPVLMVVLIGVSIYVPSLFIKPQINFIFANGGDYYTIKKYNVVGHQVVENEITYPENHHPKTQEEPKLYFYDVQSHEATEISFEEAKKYKLDSRNVSKDGFEIVSGNSYGGEFLGLFGGRSHYGERYIKKGAYNKRLRIEHDDLGYYYYYNFRFLGWVKE